ncbi:type II secretion system protein [Ruficoccus amylovorans]|uniref:type II secretion system protein n=1 Tax=Ruficoccus amylovorans TaxID=1804625 RepID=UPI001C8CB2E4|nr:type II secretion system protein [Ruficoccus amylovorans]
MQARISQAQTHIRGNNQRTRLSGTTAPAPGRSCTPAFSLIELLTVIAVIAILSAILIPVVQYTRQSARESTSISNLRQIATALNLYATEHEGRYPPGYFYKPGEGERIWTVELSPYLNQESGSGESARNIFVSPLAEIPVRDGSFRQGVVPSTYSVHGLICADISNGDTRLRQSGILRPTEVILVGEGTQRSNSSYSNASFSNPSAFRTSDSPEPLDRLIPTGSDADGVGGALRYRARGAVPVAFVDGHTELMKKGTVTYANVIADR